MIKTLDQFVTIPSLEGEDARRRKLLNVLLLGCEVITLMALLWVASVAATQPDARTPETITFLLQLVILFVILGGLFALNRFVSGIIPAIVFIGFITVMLALFDDPVEVVRGRTLFLFTAPIIMASVILPPWSSFITAAGASLLVFIVAQQAGIGYDVSTPGGFFTIAIVSWLGARSLENVLADLRKTNTELEVINKELDKRVIERTKALSEALDQVIEESNKSQAVLESIADGVVVFDPEGEAFVANPSVKYLLGQPAKQVIGQSLPALMTDKVTEPERDYLMDQLDRHEKSLENIKLDWGEKTLSTTFATVRDASGKKAGKVVVFRDYTSEAELDHMKSAFVSMASHELRTPLNAILGYSDMMREEILGPLNNEQATTVDRVMANVQRMLGLVNNLLDSAAIEAGKLTPNFREFKTQKLVDDLLAVTHVLATQQDLELEATISPNVPETLTSDPGRLQQILVNLVGNAVKFTDEGGITVKLYRPDRNHWAVDVIDTGAGIPPEAQKYIFESFRQVNDPITRKTTGSGLGLSIVKQLTNLLGGEISVESEVGEGSTFRCVFPVDVSHLVDERDERKAVTQVDK